MSLFIFALLLLLQDMNICVEIAWTTCNVWTGSSQIILRHLPPTLVRNYEYFNLFYANCNLYIMFLIAKFDNSCSSIVYCRFDFVLIWFELEIWTWLLFMICVYCRKKRRMINIHYQRPICFYGIQITANSMTMYYSC